MMKSLLGQLPSILPKSLSLILLLSLRAIG